MSPLYTDLMVMRGLAVRRRKYDESQEYLTNRDGLLSRLRHLANIFRHHGSALASIQYVNYTRRLQFFKAFHELEGDMIRFGTFAEVFPPEVISYMIPYLIRSIEKPKVCTEYPCKMGLLAWSRRARDRVAFRIAEDINAMYSQ